MKYIYCYTISMEASHDVFVDALRKIDEHYHDFEGDYGVGRFGSVEESNFIKEDDYIKVVNDYDIDVVYIEGTIEIPFYSNFRNEIREGQINISASN